VKLSLCCAAKSFPTVVTYKAASFLARVESSGFRGGIFLLDLVQRLFLVLV
jgi:hypothetical protein